MLLLITDYKEQFVQREFLTVSIGVRDENTALIELPLDRVRLT